MPPPASDGPRPSNPAGAGSSGSGSTGRHALRRVDWRFLLPDAEVRRVLVCHAVVGRHRRGLEADRVEVGVISDADDVDGVHADAIVSAPDPRLVRALLNRRPDLPVYVELGPRAMADPRWWRLLAHRCGATYLVVPGHDRRRAYVPLGDDRSLGWAMAAEGGVASTVATMRGLDVSAVRSMASVLAPHRALVLSPEPRLHAIGAWLAQELLVGAASTSHLLVTPRYSTSRHVVLLAGRVEPEVVVKTSRLAGAGVDREAAALGQLWAATGGRDIGAPRVLAVAPWGRRTVFAESAVGGRAVTERDAGREPDAIAAQLTSWVLQLPRRPAILAAPRLADLLVPALDRVMGLGAAPERAQVEATRHAMAALAEHSLPVVFEHGDVSAPNVMRTGAGLSLVDWELAEPIGLPGHDLFVALGFVARSAPGVHGATALERALLATPARWARNEVRRYARATDLPAGVLPALFVCCWARVAAALAQRAELSGGGDLTWWRSQPATRLWMAASERPSSLDWMR